jgi:hypothetical protein
MLSVLGVQWRGAGLAAACSAVVLLGLAAPAQAAAPGWLRKAFTTRLIARPKAPPAARYEIDTGGDFILDRSTPHPLVKFDDSAEVWALTVSRGPRGDLIYWNDLRQPVLRVTKFGGVTVFTARRPEGAAASMSAPCAPLRLRSVSLESMSVRIGLATLRASRAAQHAIAFEVPKFSGASAALLTDTAGVVSDALVALASRPAGRSLIGRINRVYLLVGREPDAAVHDTVLTVTVAPAEGISGRPSSLRVQQALGARSGAVYVGLTP